MSFLSEKSEPGQEDTTETSFLSGKSESQQEDTAEQRQQWGGLLAEVAQERETGRPWWQDVGLFFAWAIGFALATGIVVTVLLFIVNLITPQKRLFTSRTLSDWLFWGSALLLLIGLISPSASDMENAGKKKQQQQVQEEDKRTRSLRRRLRRVYDPWRWRFWGAALFAFGLSMLAGLFT
jgi:H+/Cl- antiporter ClcA